MEAPRVLLHITSEAAWVAAERRGVYRAPSLDTEGFIHLSLERQWLGTAARFYRGVSGLVLLVIRVECLAAPVRFEPAHGDEFPHLYGELPARAVVAARGRCILGDRGFRAAEARVEAVTLPATVRWNPKAARRARGMLAERYPTTRVYGTARRMLKDHPPQDVRSLGIDPPRDYSRAYRAAAVALWAAVVVLTYSLAAMPRDALADTASQWWPLLVVLSVGWQAGMVWLITRLMALQSANPAGGGRKHP